MAPCRQTSPISMVDECKPGNAPRLLFSAMDASVATEIERAFAQAGHVVVSNSRNHRMEADVPLLVPEINPDHLKLIPGQQRERGWKGQIVTNPNCSTIVLTLALAPLKQFGISEIIVTTLQAISGAGYPGRRLDGHHRQRDPVHRRRRREDGAGDAEDPGRLRRGDVSSRWPPRSARTAIACRWWTATLCCVSVELKREARYRRRSARRSKAYRACRSRRNLPSAPPRPVIYMEQADRPQPRSDAERESGMAAFVGRLRECPVFDYKFVALRPQHGARRGRSRRAECRADALGRNARLMIVMKFGGTSVESAAAIETRRRHRPGAADARSPWWSFPPWARPRTSCWPSPAAAIAGQARRATRAAPRPARLPSRAKARRWSPLTPPRRPRRASSTSLSRSSTELVKGRRRAGRADAALHRRHLQLRRAALQLHRHARASALSGMPAAHVDSRDVIVTDKRHTQAAPLFPQTYARLAATIPPLAQDNVVVMGGFIGATEDGVTTTLGRGGSDFTAAIVGAGIGAEEIQIWTDVDGMLTADPTVMPGGHRVKTISFAEAAELAYFGAKVLHPQRWFPRSRRTFRC